MGTYKEIEGDLITLAKQGEFDVIAHGCNCFCVMGAGLAPKMAEAFGCDEFDYEDEYLYKGDMNKLGCIDYEYYNASEQKQVAIVNAYTQYQLGAVLDYQALQLCLKKINYQFKGSKVGLPLIGGGIAGGDPETIKNMIRAEMTDCDVTLVLFKFGK